MTECFLRKNKKVQGDSLHPKILLQTLCMFVIEADVNRKTCHFFFEGR